MLPDDSRHGTSAGYAAHRDAGQSACADCRAARVRYEKRRINDYSQGRPRMIDATGTRRRIQGLVALGWTYTEIGARLGVTVSAVYRTLQRPMVQRTVAARIADVYEQMSMTLPPTDTRQQKRDASYARTVARKHGWVPPLCWTNVDDPNERPASTRQRPSYDRDELLAEWDWLRRTGESMRQAADRLGVTVDAIEKAIERDRKDAA